MTRTKHGFMMAILLTMVGACGGDETNEAQFSQECREAAYRCTTYDGDTSRGDVYPHNGMCLLGGFVLFEDGTAMLIDNDEGLPPLHWSLFGDALVLDFEGDELVSCVPDASAVSGASPSVDDGPSSQGPSGGSSGGSCDTSCLRTCAEINLGNCTDVCCF
ncbi:MAG: hypothetical protein JRH20_27890 [Deltaproteobacteria bacterium]|nr:hypothetical protein [Deltaproteobacteria bacterium]